MKKKLFIFLIIFIFYFLGNQFVLAAEKSIIKRANNGDVEAQYELGIMYFTGSEKTPQNYVKAAEWLQKAADRDHAYAQFYLGILYNRGDGLPKNFFKAAEWIGKASESGLVEAQYSLGLLYRDGQGVPQDNVNAYKWVNLALTSDKLREEHRSVILKTRNELEAILGQKELTEAQEMSTIWWENKKNRPADSESTNVSVD